MNNLYFYLLLLFKFYLNLNCRYFHTLFLLDTNKTLHISLFQVYNILLRHMRFPFLKIQNNF